MDFLNRLLNRPQPKPAICRGPATRQSAGEPITAGPLINQESHQNSDGASNSEPNSLAAESLSSASSFQSLASTLSSKSSSGICVDSSPGSPDKTFDHSYVNVDIPDLDELISACANINLNNVTNRVNFGINEEDKTIRSQNSSADCSQDQTFASAADDTIADENQIANTLVEESIQTFKTCPVLEVREITKIVSTDDVFKAPLSVINQSSSSSVIPYVSFEDSVLRKQLEESDASVVFKSALTTFQQPLSREERDNNSPTPCVEIDVRTRIGSDETSFTSAQSEENDLSFADASNEEKKQENTVKVALANVTSDEGQALDSTVVLQTEAVVEQSNAPVAKIPEENNSTFSKTVAIALASSLFADTSIETEVENEKVKTTLNEEEIASPVNDKVVAQEEHQQEESILNKSNIIATETHNLNATHDIVQEKNTLNETRNIIQEENALNTTQVIEKTNAVNVTQDIVQEQNDSRKTQNIVQETNNRDRTQEIVKDNNNLNKTQEIKAPVENEPIAQKENYNFVENQEIDRNTENSIQNETQSESKTVDVPEKIGENLQPISEEQNLNLNEQIAQKEQNQALNDEVESPINPKISVKKDLFVSNNCETSIAEEAKNSILSKTELIASTPLPIKNIIKSEISNSPKNKSALFTKPKTPRSKSLEPLDRSVNIPIQCENIKQEIISEAANETLESALSNTEIINKESPCKNKNLLTQQEPDYEAFKPQQQSTTLPFPSDCDFKVLQEAALSVAKDIDASLECEESEQFISATTELFTDPFAFDFLNQLGSKNPRRAERYDSLYMKFDPLAQRQSMLPQRNLPTSPPVDEVEEKETKVDTSLRNLATPKKNPALAAIDRLLFYSPCAPSSTETEVAEAKQKKEEPEKEEPQQVPILDEKMAKELELVRSTVLQLEGELEKQKHEHKEQLEKQKAAFEEKVTHIQTKFSQMQTQLTQEIKCKDQMTVVVEEYEKSISRLIAEREKDRQNFEVEKSKLQEELQIANQHLSNTEAAFSDVHSKYERLKNVVSAYKSNEEVLKESIAQNKEVIETLEKRYETLKSHAMAQLEKANQELSAIRKHNEAETVKLKALLRKAELKSKSLEETVEQKLKENQELTKIIDEMIARVD